MKRIITCLIIIFTIICTADISFAKKAPVGKMPEASAENDKAAKKEAQKAQKEMQKAEKEAQKAEKAAQKEAKKEAQNVTPKETKEVQNVTPKLTKEAKQEAKKNSISAQRTTTIESTRKRSALAIYLNPNLDVQEIRASHILVKKRKDAVQIRKDILSGNITFEDAAREYSLCPTGVKGGDLGYFNRKRMDQNFADRAFDLKVGEISEPVGTKFGWHLIKVFDKR